MTERRRWSLGATAAVVALALPYPITLLRLETDGIGAIWWLPIAVRALLVPLALVAIASASRSTALRLAVVLGGGGLWVGALAACQLYASWFGTVPHPETLRLVGNLPELGSQVVVQLVDAPVMLCLALWAAAGVAIRTLPPRPALRTRDALVLLACTTLAIPATTAALHLVWDRPGRVPVSRMGLYDLNEAAVRFGILDLWWRAAGDRLGRHRHPIAASDPGPLAGPALSRSPRPRSSANVILLQLESVDPWVVDAEVRGRPVMPTLRRLRERSIWIDHAFAQHSGGGSADAELATLTGLMPLATHPGLLTADFARLEPLPRWLRDEGWTTAALHPNRRTYYNRHLTYPALGFDELAFAESFRGDAAGWNARDRPFLEHAWTRIESLPEPFFALLITMQSHGPFRNHRQQPEVDPGTGASRLERDYLQAMHEVDDAVGWFLETLGASPIASRTLVAVYSDHLSQVGNDARVAGHEPMVLAFQIPGEAPVRSPKVATHLDIGPTVLDALGLETPSGWLGSSLLGEGTGAAVFNDLTEIRLVDGHPVAHRDERWMPFLLWSAVLLENRP